MKKEDNLLEIKEYNEKINEEIQNFIIKAKELEQLSNNEYEIQKTLKDNKIFLRGYILESSIPITLEEMNMKDYTLEELRNYMEKYEYQNKNENFTSYYIAFDLYDTIDRIEELTDNKIDFEMDIFTKMNINIKRIFTLDKSEYELFFQEIANYLQHNLLDNIEYNNYLELLNDIFNYYINGYPNIPAGYLYNENDL